MPCDAPILPIWNGSVGTLPTERPFLFLHPSPPLLVSDNVEKVDGSATSAVLWHRTQARTGQHRVFIWHENVLTPAQEPVIGITVEARGSPVDVSGIAAEQHHSGQPGYHDFPEIGQCLADALLSNTLSPGPLGETIPQVAAGTRANIAYWTWSTKRLLGAQVSFSLKSQEPAILRTAYAANGTTLPGVVGNPRSSVLGHPRGSWPYSECKVHIGPILGGLLNKWKRAFLVMVNQNTPDTSNPFSAAWSEDQSATAGLGPISNRAPYGAIVHIQVDFQNTCPIRVRVLLQAWCGFTAQYTGAVRLPLASNRGSAVVRSTSLE